ncbi:MAG: YHYH protein [Isosphaeraceae bacterium]
MATALGGSAAASAGFWAWSWRGRNRPASAVFEEVADGRRVVTSNGLPDHATGDYPNAHDPVPIRSQSLRFEMPERPEAAGSSKPLAMWLFGVAVNGVPFDPSGPFWNRDGGSGWQFEVMAPANSVALGIDANHAHTQGRGQYHYHGLPTGLLWSLRRQEPERPMLLLGYAADGFPIYGPEAPSRADDPKSPPKRLISGYRLKPGRRGGGPGGRFDGTFVEDFVYEAGRGDLDECNGRTGPTPEYPDGTYYYVLTDDFPYIPRFYRGEPDPTFRHGPPPGVSPPVPGELMRYRGT